MGKQTKIILNIFFHLLFWLLYGIFLFNFYSTRHLHDYAVLRIVLILLPQAIIAYTNILYLIPQYFQKKRYALYIFLSLLLLLAAYLAYKGIEQGYYELVIKDVIDRMQTKPQGSFRGGKRMMMKFMIFKDIIYMAYVVALYLLSTVYEMTSIMAQREKEAAILRSENLNSELRFLKSQINPHFLFNALNNIYALSVIKSDKTPETLLKLSDMLRYIIYDCKDDHVPVGREVSYIRNYIDLQLLKDSDIDNVRVDINVENEHLKIAPMILIPFIENSFKHSNIQDGGSIKMSLLLSGHTLDFKISNSKDKKPETKDKTGGIGLDNVLKRLDLLYPDTHTVNIEDREDSFEVRLTIRI